MSEIDQARRVAYDILHEVGSGDAYAHVALNQKLRALNLDERDAGFVTELVNGTLRYRLLLDAVLQECSNRPLDKIDPRVLDVLRLGAYQLLILKTDAYAAVNTSVDLVVSVSGDGPRGFVNGILRTVSRTPEDAWLKKVIPDSEADRDGALSVEYSHPRWMVSALRDSLGKKHADQLPQLLAANNDTPPVTLVARPGRSSVEELIEAGGVPGRWSPWAVTAPPGRVGRVAAVREGRAGVQDEGSQLVTCALANAQIDGPDRRWLDMCAGPGGKVALLAAFAAETGASVSGVELHQHRADLVDKAAAGPGFAGVVVGDARELPFDELFDRVLLDVPCTGLGVLRRRPEIRWRRQPSDIGQLAKLQTELLNAAFEATRPGGVIAYVTCSPHIAETDLVVNAAVRRRPDIEIDDARELFVGVPDLGDGPFVRLWPHLHETDAMFFALMRRT